MPTLSASAIAGYAKNAGVSGQNIDIATAIALAESGGNTEAVNHKNHNGSTDYGLWQINSVHKDLLDRNQPWSDPKNNYHIAHELYWNRGGKFQDWSTFNSGIYATRLAEATTAWSNPDMT